MSSTSPPLTPPHGGTVHEPVSPVHESVSPVREPDIEREQSPIEAVRERADGETSPPLGQSALVNNAESEKERETKKAQDLDKDIDAMFEYNVNGNGDASVSIGSIPIDSTDSTLKDISIKTASFTERVELDVNGSEAPTGQMHQEIRMYDPDRYEDSEKSFTSVSTSNSSVLAEAVVNRVLINAVKLTKGVEVKTAGGDVKVGLFQYQTDDKDIGLEQTDEEDKTITETEIGDVKVGLFQYFDDSVDNSQQNLEDTDLEDTDEKLESLNLSDQENILHLYGLGGSEVTETRIMSTPPSSPRNEDEKRDFFIDVQREIYEPQKRMFSVTQDKSSTESTPREQVTEMTATSANENGVFGLDLKDGAAAKTSQNDTPIRTSPLQTEDKEGNLSVREDEVDSDTENKENNRVPQKDPQSASFEVAPPLIQYESVKENGKFRIIKMPKEGNGSTLGTIKVGTEVTSSQSSGESPRGLESNDRVHTAASAQSPGESPRGLESKDTVQKAASGQSPGESPGGFEPKDIVQKATSSQFKGDSPREHGVGDECHVSTISKELPKRSADVVIEDEMEKPLNSVSQTLPIVTPSSSTEVQGKDKLWLSSNSEVIRSYSDNRETSLSSRGVPKMKEPGLTRAELVSPARSSRSYEDSRSYRQLSDRQVSPGQTDIDSRIKYTTRDTLGRENKRTGPEPYNLEDYREVPGRDHGHRNAEPGWRPTPYEAELIQSAYNRVTDRTGEPAVKVMTSTIDTGPIPGYKTLQEQQARWASMFQSLEEQHKVELKAQYERHQYNIHRLQQQMESELQKQHQTIRKKLDIHKEVLRRMSPERDSLSPDRVQRSPGRENRTPIGQQSSPVRDERSLPRSPVLDCMSPDKAGTPGVRVQSLVEKMTPVRSQRSPDRSRDRRSRSADGSLERQDTKPWREIYREVRAEEERRDPTPPPPIKRALEEDFANMDDSTLSRSRSSFVKSAMSPKTIISPNRERILQGSERVSPRRDRISPERDVYKVQDSSFKRETPERLRAGVERESRSRTKRSPQQLVLPLVQRREETDQTSPLRPTSTSPHVQELLDNLNEGRSSLRGLQSPSLHTEIGEKECPRAGVYSSPMPLLTGKVSKSTQASKASLDATTTSLDTSRSQSYATDRSVRYEPEGEKRRREVTESRRLDDSYLSSSSRLNLREKHSKHLADLRSYYEEELREMRRALSESLDTSGASVDHGGHATIENQLLEAENRHLLEKCRSMEDELEDLYQRMREVEQKGKGLEKRASEYAAAFSDSQAMGLQNRAHIEELQRYCRERDDLVNDLEAKVRSQEDAMKIYKKNLEEELELHRQDKSALQRIIDKYESMEREQKLLQETMTVAENQLYETRTEVVELNRTISKLELENKRLGRENDNLRHKVTQSINLTSLHESFGSPPSPRQSEPPTRRQTESPVPYSSFSADVRVPSFTGTPEPRPKSAGSGVVTDSSSAGKKKLKKSKASDWREPKQKENITDFSDRKKPSKTTGATREDHSHRPRSQQQDREPSQERQVRDVTPPRPTSSASQSESEVGDSSPLIKAERELYKLRDMMRQAVAVRSAPSPPPEPVLQKKFYGSERPSSKDDYVPDLGTPRGRREKQSNSHTSVVKTKSNSSHSRQDRSEKDKSSKKLAPSKTDKNSKNKDKGKERPKDTETRQRTPTKKEQDRTGSTVNPDEFNSPTRFDININEDSKTLSVKKVPQSGKQKNLFAESNQSMGERSHDLSTQRSHDEGTQTMDPDVDMRQTLDRLRAGNYTTRPQWEDVFTSMAKPKPEDEQKVKAMTREDRIKDRLRNIADMEHRYDELQVEKRQLESSLTKIPIHGRVSNRRQKEELEDRLDVVEKELGSLRMSLKRCNVLKTAA